MSDGPPPSVRNASKRFGYVALIVTVTVSLTVWLLLPVRPNFQRRLLAEGTTIVSLSNSKLESAPGFPHPPLIHIDGEFLIAVPENAVGLTIESRLFKLSVDSKTALRIVARSKEAGEYVQVLYGHVTAAKNYRSANTAPDQLGAGEISMVNQSIDLMEKEALRPDELHALREAFQRYGIIQTPPVRPMPMSRSFGRRPHPRCARRWCDGDLGIELLAIEEVEHELPGPVEPVFVTHR